MDINAINEILLPPFLFLVVFCTMSCQVPRCSKSATVSIEKKNSSEVALENDEANLEDPVEQLVPALFVENVPAIPNQVVLEPMQAHQQTVTPEPYDQALAVINRLSKVQLRKLCKPLGIQQKRNGVELSKELMAANLKKVLKTNPERVISTILERLNIKVVMPKEDSIGSIDWLKTA